MADGSGFTLKEINKLLPELYPKVKYDEQASLVWVVNNVRRQYLKSVKVSPKIVKGIENALCLLPHGHPFIEEFLNKYSVLDITYKYTIEDYTYPPGEEEGVSEGEGEGKDLTDTKKQYGEFKKVLLTDTEHTKLIKKFGEEGAAQWIKTLDEGIYQKKYKYTSHYMAILSWARKDNNSPQASEVTDMTKREIRTIQDSINRLKADMPHLSEPERAKSRVTIARLERDIEKLEG
ncbi:MAG: hypothetical protein KAS32_27365 [Candidatus Peribacteraceae bacterium]|nr:hypothetical protein [Candidatus Peribacteraceae bacterium]